MPSRLAIDVGRTHTDFLLVDDATGRTHVHKTLSTHADPVAGLARGLAELIQVSGTRPADIGELVHGTSVPADLMHSGGGAKVGLLVTQGFEQVLHRARPHSAESRSGRDAANEPRALAELSMTRGVAERMSPRGDAIVRLNEASARQAVSELLAAGAESLTVCFLHAYANPAHELQLKTIIRELDERIPVSLSHELTPEAGEYERALATVINAHVQPGMRRYVTSLQEKLQSAQLSPRLSFVQSTGARASADEAVETPARSILAGPAGGALAAAHLASLAGHPDALAFDMGGRSSFVCLVRDGAARMSGQTALQGEASGDAIKSGDAINLPSLDVRRIGHGAGAVAQVVAQGTLRVGSRSMLLPSGPVQSQPPARPTLADANAVLGRLAATPPTVNMRAAEELVAALARELGVDPLRAAEGIIDIANENMAGALRRAAAEKGLNPARLALVAYGGAGPMHACALGMLTGCAPVIVPRYAGVMSALGFLYAPYSYQFALTVGRALPELTAASVDQAIERLASQARAWLAREAPAGEGAIRFRADIGYLRGTFQTSIGIDPAKLRNGGLAALSGQLDEAHQQRFGYKLEQPMQLITLRAIASAPADRFALRKFERAGVDPSAARIRDTQVYFDGAFLNTAVYERDRLLAGNRIAGPAIVVQRDTTTVIHPGHVGEVDETLNLLIRAEGADLTDG